MEVCLKGTENKPKEAGVAHFQNYRVINALIIVAIQGGKSISRKQKFHTSVVLSAPNILRPRV